MNLSLVTIALLVLVSGVHWAGYRTGFKASQDRVAAMFKSFSDPVALLLDRMNASVDQAVESSGQDEPRGR